MTNWSTLTTMAYANIDLTPCDHQIQITNIII